MYNKSSFDILSKNCLNIIENNTPERSIKIISKLKIDSDMNEIGEDYAQKIYKCYSKENIEYSSKIYGNNISEYKRKTRCKNNNK